MTIHRNKALSPVRDFVLNVQPQIRNNMIAEEIYDQGELTGWKILMIGNM